MKNKLNDLGLLWLRIAVGLGLMWHGWGKLERGIDAFAEGAVTDMGLPLPYVFATAAIASELLGGLFILLGLWTRYAAILAGFTIGVAFFVRHAADSFNQKEKAAAYLVVLMAILIMGAGKYAVHPSGGGGRKSTPKKDAKWWLGPETISSLPESQY